MTDPVMSPPAAGARLSINQGAHVEFRGPISAGTITAEFLADFSNDDPDLLIGGYSALGGGQTDQDRDETTPGGTASVSIEATGDGTLEIIVATGNASDSGRLRISTDGELRDDQAITGPAHWVYSVEG